MPRHTFTFQGRRRHLTKRRGYDGAGDPWRLRVHAGGVDTVLTLTPHLHERDGTPGALERAREHLRQLARGADAFAEWRATTGARAVLTVATIAASEGAPAISTAAAEWWGARSPLTINAASDCQAFGEWRGQKITAAARAAGHTGHRAAVLDIAGVSRLLAWAAGRGMIPSNPLASRPKLPRAGGVRHANEHQPASAAEVEALAAHIAGGGDVVNAARLVFAALSGLRISEQVALRWDAAQTGAGVGAPGWIEETPGGRLLHVARAKARTHAAARGVLPMSAALVAFVAAWHEECARCWPASPWWFPAASDASQPAHHDDLGRALRRAARALGLPRRTAHGLRSFFVSVRLAEGATPERIAAEVGHRGGAGLIRRVYGLEQGLGDQWRGRPGLTWPRFDFLAVKK